MKTYILEEDDIWRISLRLVPGQPSPLSPLSFNQVWLVEEELGLDGEAEVERTIEIPLHRIPALIRQLTHVLEDAER